MSTTLTSNSTADAEARSFNTPSKSRDWAWSVPTSSMPRKCALVAIAEACDKNGVTYWGLDTIAEAAGISARQLRDQVKGLASDKLIDRYERIRRNGSRSTDLIVLRMPRAVDLNLYEGRNGASVGDRIEPKPNKTGPTRNRRGALPKTVRAGREKVPPPEPPFEPLVEPQQLASANAPVREAAAVTAAATSLENETARNEGEAVRLARLVENRTGFTPAYKPHHEQQLQALIAEGGREEYDRRVEYALAEWPDVLTDHLGRFGSLKAWAELGKQMAAKQTGGGQRDKESVFTVVIPEEGESTNYAGDDEGARLTAEEWAELTREFKDQRRLARAA